MAGLFMGETYVPLVRDGYCIKHVPNAVFIFDNTNCYLEL